MMKENEEGKQEMNKWLKRHEIRGDNPQNKVTLMKETFENVKKTVKKENEEK